MSYRDLEISKLAHQAATDAHHMTLQDLPRFETYKEGAQIRRSVKSTRFNIVEGYGRRRYKQEFIRFLVFARASCDETFDHLDGRFETGSLTDETTFRKLGAQLDVLGRKLSDFIAGVEHNHRTGHSNISHPESRVPHPA